MSIKKKIISVITATACACTLVSFGVSSVNAYEHSDLKVVDTYLQDELENLVWVDCENPLANFAPDTTEWLQWYNSLSAEEQLTINYWPDDAGPRTYSLSAYEEYVNNSEVANEKVSKLRESRMVTGGYELPYDPTGWENVVDRANCYAYMWNIVSRIPGDKLQPGGLAGQTFTSLTGSNIYNASKLDANVMSRTIRASSYSEVPGYREYKVALVIAPGYDYHWYRQDSDGGWSHKRGLTSVDFRDASGQYISDPYTCDRSYGYPLNYSTWCGYFIVSY